MRTVSFLESERLILRGLEFSDTEGGYLKWLNDPIVCKYNSHHRFPMNTEKLKQYIEGAYGNQSLILAMLDLSGLLTFQDLGLLN